MARLPMPPPYEALDTRSVWLGPRAAQARPHVLEAVGVGGEVDVAVDQRQGVDQSLEHPVHWSLPDCPLPHFLEEFPLVAAVGEHHEVRIGRHYLQELVEDSVLLIPAFR